jgi:hypothetical protein
MGGPPAWRPTITLPTSRYPGRSELTRPGGDSPLAHLTACLLHPDCWVPLGHHECRWLRSSDSLLAKPDRAGSLAGDVVIAAGRGRRGLVRECPLGTGHDRCEWHGSGTAGEDDGAHTRRRRLPGRPEGEARPRWPTATVASREGGAAAMAAKSAQQPAGSPAKSDWQVGKRVSPGRLSGGLGAAHCRARRARGGSP